MKNTIRFISGIVMAVAVIGAITLLFVKYFDVLMKVIEDVKSQFSAKRPSFLADACCGDEDFEDEEVME